MERWALIIATPVGPQHVSLHLSQVGNGWEGTITSNDRTMPVSAVGREGHRLTWSMHLTSPLRLALTFDVTIDGDRMTGNARAGRLLTSAVVGRRVV